MLTWMQHTTAIPNGWILAVLCAFIVIGIIDFRSTLRMRNLFYQQSAMQRARRIRECTHRSTDSCEVCDASCVLHNTKWPRA